jgi:gamma-glutamylcyclotransferase (GGCT)/AIG2-like uncharacterized protein YtfP
MGKYLFVYGTLRPSLAPPQLQGLMRRWRAVGGGSVRGRLYDLIEYPGAVLDTQEERRIIGEVYELPNEDGLLSLLDQYEGFDSNQEDTSLFVRRRCRVTLDDGRLLECSIYVYHGDTSSAQLIANGDYLYVRSQ